MEKSGAGKRMRFFTSMAIVSFSLHWISEMLQIPADFDSAIP